MEDKYKTLRELQRAISSGKEIAPESITDDLVIETIKKGKDITFIPNLCKRMYDSPRNLNALIAANDYDLLCRELRMPSNVSTVAKGYVHQILKMYYYQNIVVEKVYGGIKFSPTYTASLLKKLEPYAGDYVIKGQIRVFKEVEEMGENYAVLRGYRGENEGLKVMEKLEDKLMEKK